MNSNLKANKNFSCFVTGTDTEIGKTFISCTLLHALGQSGVRAVGMKPVAAGAQLRGGVWRNEDADALAQASTLELPSSLTSPYVFRDAIAPHIAAMREGVSMDCGHILDCYTQIVAKADAVVVEGVGGFRVPLSDQFDTADLAQQLALPVILVVGLRLGCINHALLTADAIAARGLKLVGWVANTVDNQMPSKDENVDTLRCRLSAPLLGTVPRLALPSAAKAAQYLDFTGLPNWPRTYAEKAGVE